MVGFRADSGRGRFKGDSGKIRGIHLSVRFASFELDSDRRQLLRDGSEVHLTPKAFDLLGLLVAEAPRVVRKDELHERLWPGTFVADATLVGLVKEVRRALDDRDTTSPLIRTAHGVGYAFAGAIERAAANLVPVISRWLIVGTRRVSIGDGEHVIGRDPAVAIHVDSSGVSRRHARILVSGGSAAIEDLDSKNGTRVNDSKVAGRVALHDGDRIQLGPAVIVFRISGTGMSTETISPKTSQ
jgi:DNA-binding winged helix-turn-helix (wHTH) protein